MAADPKGRKDREGAERVDASGERQGSDRGWDRGRKQMNAILCSGSEGLNESRSCYVAPARETTLATNACNTNNTGNLSM